MRSMRVYSRRAYRNTIAFGVALVAGGVALLLADIWLLTAIAPMLRAIVGIVDFFLYFFGLSYMLAGFWGLAKAKK
jgi:hypothetical protein